MGICDSQPKKEAPNLTASRVHLGEITDDLPEVPQVDLTTPEMEERKRRMEAQLQELKEEALKARQEFTSEYILDKEKVKAL